MVRANQKKRGELIHKKSVARKMGITVSQLNEKIEKQKDPATKKVYDFKGMTIILGDWWTDPSAAPASKKQEDDKAWQEWVNQTYNMKCYQAQAASWASMPQFVTNY